VRCTAELRPQSSNGFQLDLQYCIVISEAREQVPPVPPKMFKAYPTPFNLHPIWKSETPALKKQGLQNPVETAVNKSTSLLTTQGTPYFQFTQIPILDQQFWQGCSPYPPFFLETRDIRPQYIHANGSHRTSRLISSDD
jgi:hypothetical protein